MCIDPAAFCEAVHFRIMTRSVAFVGAGPTTIYTLHALLEQGPPACSLTLFERQESVGRGTPYRPGWNDPAMLSNIAGIELPPLEEPLVEWLNRQSDERLAQLHITRASIDNRTFYPRVALGEYFYDQLQAMLERAIMAGIQVTIRTRCDVVDAESGEDGMTLTVQPSRGEPFRERFDHVVLATGHQWPAEPEASPGYFLSPWPASTIEQLPPCSVGIRGSSLTAIDAAVALAVSHGDFVRRADGNLTYALDPDANGLLITMLSRKGLLPEADFYFPIPYQPLAVCTSEAVQALIEQHAEALLDDTYALFREELRLADSGYADRVDLDSLEMAQFCETYFADRMGSDPFEWAKSNLAEAQRNYAEKRTVGWRYAILRMHEVVQEIVPHLTDQDFRRFSKWLKPVFVDDYATVPHESVERLLALHEAGVLNVLAVGEDYTVDTQTPEYGAMVELDGRFIHYDVFIEATGQQALSAKDFPFPSLREQGIIGDVTASSGDGPSRGIVIDDEFHPLAASIPQDQIFCLSLPFIMGRHPFIQGITSSHEMAQIVAPKLRDALVRETGAEEDGPSSDERVCEE